MRRYCKLHQWVAAPEKLKRMWVSRVSSFSKFRAEERKGRKSLLPAEGEAELWQKKLFGGVTGALGKLVIRRLQSGQNGKISNDDASPAEIASAWIWARINRVIWFWVAFTFCFFQAKVVHDFRHTGYESSSSRRALKLQIPKSDCYKKMMKFNKQFITHFL